MVYSDPFVHLSITDSHVNYDLPRMRGNETPSDWKERIWDTLMGYRKNHLTLIRDILSPENKHIYYISVMFGSE